MTVWSSFALEWNSCVWISSVDRESESILKKERGGRREREREKERGRKREKDSLTVFLTQKH